ncbi:MAG: hypothetical protein AAFZ18_09500, partial [Myxococcota bacterium]
MPVPAALSVAAAVVVLVVLVVLAIVVVVIAAIVAVVIAAVVAVVTLADLRGGPLEPGAGALDRQAAEARAVALLGGTVLASE